VSPDVAGDRWGLVDLAATIDTGYQPPLHRLCSAA